MKKVFWTLVALMTLVSCHGVRINNTKNYERIEERRQLTGFERINMLGSMDVKYKQADSVSVSVKAPANIINLVKTSVEGNSLMIRMKKNSSWRIIGRRGVTVYVTSPDLIGVKMVSSGDFDCKHHLDTDNLDIEITGSGDATFSDIVCDNLNVKLTGSGDVKIDDVTTQQSEIYLTGSGDVKVKFSNSGVVKSHLTGSGDISLKGIVRGCQSKVLGPGEIHTNQLTIINQEQN